MLENVQCIVVSTQGSLGLVHEAKAFTMLRTVVEFDETPTESAHRILRTVLGDAVDYHRIEQLNLVSESEDTAQYTFVLRVREAALNVMRTRGFQWLKPSYRATLEAMHPQLLGEGVASTYRRAMAAKSVT